MHLKVGPIQITIFLFNNKLREKGKQSNYFPIRDNNKWQRAENNWKKKVLEIGKI